MKKNKIIYWFSIFVIILVEAVLPLIIPQSESARSGAIHLGYPAYFGKMLIVFKIMGVLVLLIPKIPQRLKEWAFSGFAFDLIFASASHYLVDGWGFSSFFPLIILAILAAAYISSHKIYLLIKNQQQWHS